MNDQTKMRLADALADAGCSQTLIADIMRCEDTGEKKNKLLCYRTALLKELHTSQKQLDVLDYIVRFLDGRETAI